MRESPRDSSEGTNNIGTMRVARLTNRRDAWRIIAAACILALAIATASIAQSGAAGAADYPGQAEIRAAKAAVANASSDVAQLDAAIVELEAAAQAADAAARLAADLYAEAKSKSDMAEIELKAATERSDAAQDALDAARADLAQVAMAAYREGGGFDSLEAIMSADGFDDVIVRSEAIDRASEHADDTVQRVKAAELVAQTMQEYADKAAKDAAAAAEAAAVALAAAEDARRNAVDALAQAESTREEAISRLAQLKRTSVALERERQAGLAYDRYVAEQLAWEAAQGTTTPPTGGDPTTPPAGGGTTTPPTGGGTTTPPTTPPAPGPPASEPTGSWKSSAAQGQAAVNHALTLMGSPYQSGGEGPAYDCSGLTKVSWGVAGFYLPHSSRSQYANVTKVAYADMRPGDLIFWGTGRDASKIYHVAMYIGGGKVAEASTHGVPAKIRVYNNWAVGDLMPYAGRV